MIARAAGILLVSLSSAALTREAAAQPAPPPTVAPTVAPLLSPASRFEPEPEPSVQLSAEARATHTRGLFSAPRFVIALGLTAGVEALLVWGAWRYVDQSFTGAFLGLAASAALTPVLSWSLQSGMGAQSGLGFSYLGALLGASMSLALVRTGSAEAVLIGGLVALPLGVAGMGEIISHSASRRALDGPGPRRPASPSAPWRSALLPMMGPSGIEGLGLTLGRTF